MFCLAVLAGRYSGGMSELFGQSSSRSVSPGRVGVHLGRPRRRNRPVAAMPTVSPPPRADQNTGGVSLAEAVAFLADLAKTIAAARRWVCIIEYAGSSESTYVHVRRDNLWYGVRVSAHPSKYACSSDYQQILLPKRPTASDIDDAAERLRHLVVHGGHRVAEPHLVRTELWAEQIAAADGQTCQTTDPQGNVIDWRWSAEQLDWQTEVETDSPPPMWIPRVTLDTGTTAAIRHRVNRREGWGDRGAVDKEEDQDKESV